MDNKTIIGYDILAKRAIETESGINIDDALNRITAFRVVRGEGEDHHPASDVTVSTKILYYTKTDKGYIAWIWVDGEGWVSAGGVSNESWKAWSEEHGSSAANEDSVYIGENLTAEGDFPSYQFGHDNVVDGEVPEFVEPQEIVSMNIGAMNTVHGEGINIGKKNTTDTFGITIGQRNVSHGAGIAIGEDLTVDNGSFGIGKQMRLESGSYAIGSNGNDFRVGCGSHLFGSNNSGSLDNGSYLFGGQNNLQSTYGSIIVGLSNQLLYSSTGGISIFGCNNIIGNGDGASGSVALGNYHDIKGSSSVSLGIGAGSKNCSIAISAKGTNSQLGSFADTGSIAIGNRGVYAYEGSTSIGTDGVASHYHGISIGHGGVHAYNYSFAFGKSVTAHSYSMALGMDGCYAFDQSISVGRSGSVSLDRSMTFGRDGVFAWQRGIAIGEAGVQAISNAVALGLENVKGSTSSVSVGRAGVYTYNASIALGNGGYAVDGSMSLLNVPNQSSFRYKYDGTNDYIQNYALFWFSGKDGRDGYVDVKLTGISKDSDGYVVNGTTYSRLKDVPFRDLTVYIRGYIDGQGNIVPYYTSKDMLEPPSSEDIWVRVNWGDGWRHDDTVSVISSFSETEIGFGASGGSLVVGNTTACATNGSVAISLRNQGQEPGFSLGLVQLSNNIITISPRTGVYSNNQFAPISLAEASSSRNSLAIGTGSKADNGSTSIGVNSFADRGSMAIGYGLWSTTNGFGKAIDDSLIISTVGYPSSGVRTRGESFCNSIAIGSGPYSSNSSQSIGVCTKAESKSVSIGYYSRSSNESIAIGDDNETGLNAFAIGTKNLSYGWSMLFGVDNKTPRESGAHATLIGYNNTSTSNIEKLEKTLRVKYDKQTALSKLADRYTVIHNAQLNLGSPYMTSSELNRVMSYESALYDYYANGGTYPSYDSEYAAIKTALFSKPMISMDASTWDSWSNLYTYGVYYIENALYYLESYGPSDSSYTSCRDYVYTYAPAFVDIMISYATDHMPSRYLSALIVAKTTLENRPEIIPSSLFNEQSKYMEIVNLFLDSYRNKDYSYTGSMPTESQFTYYTYETELNKLLNNMYGIRTGSDETVYIDEIEEAICNSVIFGANNTSNHYNSILVGTKNQSLSPVIESADTDDDGFMMAIGFKNTVGRNYDIAIGYMSTANGGENVAIQHSTAGNGANSFHNLAMFDSTAIGIGNIAIQQSEASGGVKNLAMFESKSCGIGNIAIMESEFDFGDSYQAYIDNYVTHNVLFNSKFTGNLNTYQVDQNTLFNAKLNYTTGYGGVANNVIGLIDANLIGNSGIHNNIICGQHTTEHGISINISNDLANNFLIHCGGYSDGNDFTDNTMVGTIIHATSADLGRNIAISAKISANNALLVDNLVLQSSEMNIDGGNPAESNVLLSGALLAGGKLTSSIPPKKNLLFGAGGVDVYGCFAMSDEPGTLQITNSRRVFMFGDNNITETENVQVLGDANIVHYTNRSFIAGTENNISPDRGGSRLDSSYGSSISESVVIGDKNKILSHNGVHVHRNVAIGCVNTILGDETHENAIIGQYNRIYNITAPTVMSSNTIQNGIDNDIQLGKFTSDRDCLVSSRNKPTFSGYFYSGEYYYENGLLVSPGYDDRIRQLPKVSITVTQLINSYGSGTLTNHTLYNATGSSVNLNNISFKVYRGIVITAGVPYIVVNGTPDKCDDYDVSSDYSTRTVGNRIFGSENELNGLDLINNTIVGYNNYVCRYGDKNGIRLTLSGLLSYTENDPETYFCPYGNYAVWDGRYIEKFYSGRNYTYANGMLKESWYEELPTVSIAPAALYQGTIDHTLQSGVKYAVTNTSTYTLPSPIRNYKTLSTKYTYKIGGGLAYPETVEDSPAIGYGISGTYGARLVQDNIILGSTNGIHENIIGYTVIGKLNNVICTETVRDGDNNFAISCGFIQGNNNIATDGSNIICMGNGNESTGHNSVAIGSQLISRQWQTVIGKYNVPIDGPNRLESENPKDPSKALFIIGNGFSTTDGDEWMNPDNITRSNAMVVFADGTVRAKKFVSDEPELELVNGTGIVFNDDLNNNRRTISVTADIANLIEFLGNRPAQGTYAINSVNGTLTWVQIGSTQV